MLFKKISPVFLCAILLLECYSYSPPISIFDLRNKMQQCTPKPMEGVPIEFSQNKRVSGRGWIGHIYHKKNALSISLQNPYQSSINLKENIELQQVPENELNRLHMGDEIEFQGTMTYLKQPASESSSDPAWVVLANTHIKPISIPSSAVVIPEDFDVTVLYTGCFGTCPSYTVHVNHQGMVEWTGSDFVEKKGKESYSVSQEVMKQLQEVINRVDFEHVDRCEQLFTDVDSQIVHISITQNGKRKEISYQPSTRLTCKVQILEDAINQLLQTQRLIGSFQK